MPYQTYHLITKRFYYLIILSEIMYLKLVENKVIIVKSYYKIEILLSKYFSLKQNSKNPNIYKQKSTYI